nr:hypothetical protein [Tanacetum cinerariifolium]
EDVIRRDIHLDDADGVECLSNEEIFAELPHFLSAHTVQYALVIKPTIYVSCIKQFWDTAASKVNDAVQLCALIDGKKVVVTEDVIRRDIHLDDADGVECLSNEEIF